MGLGDQTCTLCLSIAGSYPFPDSDPFIIEECPHIYFTGNQPSFRHKLIHSKYVHTH